VIDYLGEFEAIITQKAMMSTSIGNPTTHIENFCPLF